MIKRFYILLLIGLANTSAIAVTTAPTLSRACLNVGDSIVTIDYTKFTDLCGSFVEHHIYGSENGTNYRLLNTQINATATTIQLKLPNSNPTWSFYFETRYKCNGSDTAKSNVLYLDIVPPALNPIDSISIDVLTQKPVIGWQLNDSQDTEGYRIYTTSGGISNTLADTFGLYYVVNSQRIDSVIRYAIAAFDTCNLFSAISNFHSPMVLKSTLDTCTKTASLNWTSYVGWTTQTQEVYISINGSSFVPTTIQPNDLSYSHNGVNLGDSICFFIRARNIAGITSSSNVRCIKLFQPILPKTTYLSQVTVASESSIKIEAYVDNLGVSDSVVLYSALSSNTRIGSLQLQKGKQFYSWVDNNANTPSTSKTYFIRTFAPCLGGTSASLSGRSILLEIKDETLTWNSYINWSGNVLEYIVFGFDGSTWNILNSTSDLTYTNTDTTIQCFRIDAVENQNIYGFNRVSQSNRVCAQRRPVFYVPNSLNPWSHVGNYTLKVIGPSIDVARSTMLVFNRWGEQIFTSTNIEEGWSVDATKTFVPLGIYFYDISIIDLIGNRHRLTGSVRVIR
ncbi:MAG: hypothetical protein ACI9JN_000168 [Bacteroidia bacterium]